MKLTAADIAKYPKFAQYVRVKIPELVHVKSVMFNLKSKGSMTDAQVRDALRWGAEPLIVITDLSGGQCGVPSAYGCTRSTNLHQIEIDEGTVADFEKAPYSLGVGKNARGQNVFIVGVTLLHELTHVGKFLKAEVEATEAGADYEIGAYGKVIP
ncbi:hypothetical protein EP7_002134 [Isosphaeraceae bacterium EP7]